MSESPHMAALETARQTAHVRAVAKRLIEKRSYAEGKEAVAELLTERSWPAELDGMPVFDLVKSIRQSGPWRARGLLDPAGISETTTFGALTDRQRWALIAVLRFDATRYQKVGAA